MSQDDLAASSADVAEREQRAYQARVAWLYFVEQMTQEEIARKLSTTRPRVNRILAACRESGMVRVQLTGTDAARAGLEESFKRKYGLAECQVVPAPAAEDALYESIGAGLGMYLNHALKPDLKVGIHPSRRHLTRRSISVLSMVAEDRYRQSPHLPEIRYRLRLLSRLMAA